MKRAAIVLVGVLAALLLVVAIGQRLRYQNAHPFPEKEAAGPASAVEGSVHRSFLYSRIRTVDGAIYEGKIRFGGGEEAFWSDLFNGFKLENPWAGNVPPGQLPKEDHSLQIFGLVFIQREQNINLARPFMTPFGNLVRLEAEGRDVYVTLKSGAKYKLDRFSSSDFDDGVRVWDATHGIVDLDSLRVRSIEFLPSPGDAPAPARLYGKIHTEQQVLTGFVQWNRRKSLGTDTLEGRSAGSAISLPFDSIRTITRRSPEGIEVLLVDGRQMLLTGSRDAGMESPGLSVDDARYGRVHISWRAFQRVEFHQCPAGPGYDDFPPGVPLAGAVTTRRSGRRLSGRLVFDLDESEDTETLDAPSGGLDYIIPFRLISSIHLPPPGGEGTTPATVKLLGGEELRLEREGDLGEANAGLLVFPKQELDGQLIPWADIERIDFEIPGLRARVVEEK